MVSTVKIGTKADSHICGCYKTFMVKYYNRRIQTNTASIIIKTDTYVTECIVYMFRAMTL